MLVTSTTYRQTRLRPADGTSLMASVKDPDNRLLSRMTRLRLDAECVRDAVLQASGRLDLRMG